MLTFRDLQLEVLRWIDEGDDTDTTLALVKDALNRSHRKLLGSRTWPFMAWPRTVTLTTVAGQTTYPMYHGVSKVLTLYDDNGDPFPLISRREWEILGVNRLDAQDSPYGAIYGDVWPVSAQPTNEIVSIVSTSAGDTTQTVRLAGLDSNGLYADETITANGTTAVPGTILWSHIWAVTKIGTWAGTLSVTSVAQGTILLLRASEYAKQHPTLEFIETPASARSYSYTAQRTPGALVYDNDIPDTPFPYSEIHVYDALLDLSTYNTELGAKEQRLWQDRYTKLWEGLVQSVDEGIAGSRPRFVRQLS